MSNLNSNQQRIEILEQMKSQIAIEYNALTRSTNEIYNHHLNELSKIRKAKLDEVDQWAENERKSAEQIAEGEIYQNDSDLKNKRITVKTRISDYIAFKQKALNEKFPEAAQYFISQGYKSPIYSSYQPDPIQFKPSVEVDTTDEPLFTPNEIDDDISIFRESNNYQNVHSVLQNLQTNDSAILTVKGMPPLRGTIGQIFEDTFEFILENSKVMKITFQSITYGQSTIEPA